MGWGKVVECSVKAFRDSMINNYKNSAVGWANDYSPILDVTDTIKKIAPGVTKAFLTIYGDDLSKIRVVGGYSSTPISYPDGRPADRNVYGDKATWSILYNWLAGEEWERQKCEKDGKVYWVVYPCKLEIQGTLDVSCTKEAFRDSMVNNYKGKALTWYNQYSPVIDVTNTVRQYLENVTKATLTIYGADLSAIKVIGKYDSSPDKYPNGKYADIGKYGSDAVKNIVENWMRGQEWERMRCSQDGEYYWVVFPCRLEVESEPTKIEGLQVGISPMNPQAGQTVKVFWSYTNTWSKSYNFKVRFTLRKPNYQTQTLKTVESFYLKPKGSKEGMFTFSVPNLPGKYVLTATYYMYTHGKWVEGGKVTIEFIVPGVGEPTVHDFVNSLVAYYGSKTPTIDVSRTLENRLPGDPRHSPPKDYLDNITLFGIRMVYMDNNYYGNAKLTLHLEIPEEIEIIEYGYDRPPERYTWSGKFAENVVGGWLQGYEMQRMYSTKSGKWYWVKIPCDFTYKLRRATPILEISKNSITFGVENDWCDTSECGRRPYGAKLFIDGEEVATLITDYKAWKYQKQRKFTKTINMPPLSRGLHTVTLVLLADKSYRSFGAITKQIYVAEPIIGWSVDVDKLKVSQGDTLTISATIRWKSPTPMRFKLGIDAFGKHYESNAVQATTSPVIIKAPITVPNVSVGTYSINVTLYAYY